MTASVDGAEALPLDALLPSQYEDMRRSVGRDPEHRLMLAVLEDALRRFQKHRFATGGDPRREFLAERQWFVARDWSWPFSFENICAVLGLDAAALRDQLLRWEREAQPGDREVRRQRIQPPRGGRAVH